MSESFENATPEEMPTPSVLKKPSKAPTGNFSSAEKMNPLGNDDRDGERGEKDPSEETGRAGVP